MEKERREFEEKERIKIEKIRQETEEKERIKKENKKKEELARRKIEEERRKKELEEKRKIEEEKHKQELDARVAKVNESKEKMYNAPEEKPLYLMLDIDNPERLFTNSIMELGLNTRAANALLACGCNDVFSLLSFSIEELMNLNNLGKASVSEIIRLVELKYKGQATYVFNYKEKSNTRAGVRKSNGIDLTDEEIRMIINARKEKEQEEKRIAEEEKHKAFCEDLSLITSSPIVQVGGTHEITNNIFNLTFMLTEDVEEKTVDFVFVDDCGEKISDTRSACFKSKGDACKVSFELLSGKSFSSLS